MAYVLPLSIPNKLISMKISIRHFYVLMQRSSVQQGTYHFD